MKLTERQARSLWYHQMIMADSEGALIVRYLEHLAINNFTIWLLFIINSAYFCETTFNNDFKGWEITHDCIASIPMYCPFNSLAHIGTHIHSNKASLRNHMHAGHMPGLIIADITMYRIEN